jgi:putative ABC transport system permease protein
MPLSSFRKRFGTRRSIDLFVRAADGVPGLEKSMDDVRVIMRARRRTAFRAKDPFAMVNAEALQSAWKGITSGAFALMILISGISLFVGGIVIMNIMLASVTERTREIGLRRSLGARKKHIMLQFLTESAVLAATGGLIGILAAYSLVFLVKALFSFPMETPLSAVILSLCVATGVGLFFGIFPAMRAAKLDPIEALRADG